MFKKKNLPAQLILFSMLLFATAAFGMENISEGFRGMPWGAPVPSEDFAEGNEWGLTKLGVFDNLGDVYSRSEPKDVFIGKAKITIPYIVCFPAGLGFTVVLVNFKGRADYELIRKECIENWGEPSQEKRAENEDGGDAIISVWPSEKVIINLSFSFNAPETGVLAFYRKEFFQERLHAE